MACAAKAENSNNRSNLIYLNSMSKIASGMLLDSDSSHGRAGKPLSIRNEKIGLYLTSHGSRHKIRYHILK